MAKQKLITKTIKVTMDKKLADMEGGVFPFVCLALDSYVENNPEWIAEQLNINTETEKGEIKLDELFSSISVSEGGE